MKTYPLDFVLSSICITLLLILAIATSSALSIDSPYHLLLDVAVFLFAYGVYTGLLLALMRKFYRYPQGVVEMDAYEFTYWKLNAVLVDLAWKALSPFNTVFSAPLFCKLFGVQMGKQVALGGTMRDHPLIYIADYATIGQDSVMVGHAITHDHIVLKPIRIGKNALVGINCVVMPGVTMGDGAVLAPGAVARQDTQIPAHELWGGVPAKKIKDLTPLEKADD